MIGAKFQTKNSTEYFRLTQKEFNNHFEPKQHIFSPESEDYKAGQTLRFFAQKINEPLRITEIDEDQFKSFNKENKEGIDSRLYNAIMIDWVLTGENPSELNQKTIELTSILYPGFERVRISASELTKQTIFPDPIQTDLFTRGGEYKIRETVKR